MAPSEQRATGRLLNKEWRVDAKHALFSKDGEWYHRLTSFPGAFFDVGGHILFDTEKDYLNCAYLQIGKEVHVPALISSIPGYVKKPLRWSWNTKNLSILTLKMKKKQTPKNKSKGNAPAMKVEETAEHARLKATVKDIIAISGLKVDTEVHLNFSNTRGQQGSLIDECSIDVAAYGTSDDGKMFLVIFECKGGRNFPEPLKKISAWESNIDKIRKGQTNLLSSDNKAIKKKDFDSFEEIRVCYVFGRELARTRYEQIESIMTPRGFHVWDNNALTYYRKDAATIGKAIKNEILKEFRVGFELAGSIHEKAIKLKQGNLQMFLFGAKPADLLRIGYVSRRASQRPEAYQRILNKERMNKIKDFVSAAKPLLPNAIIIAFDGETEIQDRLQYNEQKTELSFPSVPCCAWIIDGQHRVYGFLNTKFDKGASTHSAPVFRLPVVAFKNLSLLLQNRAFVDINYHQKRIDPTLLCDLAATLPDLQNELTWPSLLAAELNKSGPLEGKIRISELDRGKPISISSFARYGLLEGLLGYDSKSRNYNGALFEYSPFKKQRGVNGTANRQSLRDQVDLLQRYFAAVATNTAKKNPQTDPWTNSKNYALVKATGINALLLVLARIMEKYPQVEKDIGKSLNVYLKPMKTLTFTKKLVARQGGGWKGFRGLANMIIKRLNAENSDSLKPFGKKDKK